MTEDVDQYYRQMAANYKEAEEKTKVQIETQEREASMLLNGGEVHQFKRAMKKVSRLKDWQEHCVRERERFEQAAEKLEQPAAHGNPQAPPGDGQVSRQITTGRAVRDPCCQETTLGRAVSQPDHRELGFR